jgi:mRNA-degrading endonuclease YafQ of YafQ-DinJ toxin-antitoxin module
MAARVESYQFGKTFKKEYNNLPSEIKKIFNEKLSLLLQDLLHPSLRVKRIQGTRDRWEGSITMKYRFTFQWDGTILTFRRIGTHDILLKETR